MWYMTTVPEDSTEEIIMHVLTEETLLGSILAQPSCSGTKQCHCSLSSVNSTSDQRRSIALFFSKGQNILQMPGFSVHFCWKSPPPRADPEENPRGIHMGNKYPDFNFHKTPGQCFSNVTRRLDSHFVVFLTEIDEDHETASCVKKNRYWWIVKNESGKAIGLQLVDVWKKLKCLQVTQEQNVNVHDLRRTLMFDPPSTSYFIQNGGYGWWYCLAGHQLRGLCLLWAYTEPFRTTEKWPWRRASLVGLAYCPDSLGLIGSIPGVTWQVCTCLSKRLTEVTTFSLWILRQDSTTCRLIRLSAKVKERKKSKALILLSRQTLPQNLQFLQPIQTSKNAILQRMQHTRLRKTDKNAF